MKPHFFVMVSPEALQEELERRKRLWEEMT